MESCGRAENLEWVLAPWWRLDVAESDVTGAMEVGTDIDHGGGVGFVYLVAGDETAEEYVTRVAAWRSLLRGTCSIQPCNWNCKHFRREKNDHHQNGIFDLYFAFDARSEPALQFIMQTAASWLARTT